MDWIFFVGIFLLPFENFCFAPSAGWAAITPIVWFIYLILNLKSLQKSLYRYRYFIIILFILAITTLINYMFIGYEIENVINAGISIGLGFLTLLSMDIFFIVKKHKFKEIVNILFVAYIISIIVGCLQFVAVEFKLNWLKNIFIAIEKRSYIKYNRIQFTFTEPSFIGMHLFGILLPIYLVTKEKKLLFVIISFSILSVIFSSGVRILLDILVVTMIMFGFKNIHNVKVIFSIIAIIPIAILGIEKAYNSNARVKAIIDNGIYADGSLASRYFRINASIIGYKKDFIHSLFGYGLGNAIIPLRAGYNEARLEYHNNYMKEVNELQDENFINDSVCYCLYIRLISEFGLIVFFIIFIYFFKLNKNIPKDDLLRHYLWVMLYIYIQFESYIFYTMWLFIIICLKAKKQENIDYERKKIL